MDLYNELTQKIKELNISIKKLRETGTEYAEAERDYKITLRQETLNSKSIVFSPYCYEGLVFYIK